jgi:hypothetical protein
VLPGVGDGAPLAFGAVDAAVDGEGSDDGFALADGTALAGAALGAALGATDATGAGAGGVQSRGWTSVSPVFPSYLTMRTPESRAHASSES